MYGYQLILFCGKNAWMVDLLSQFHIIKKNYESSFHFYWGVNDESMKWIQTWKGKGESTKLEIIDNQHPLDLSYY